MKEWREIDGFPDYMVSNTREIKSLNYNKTGREKVLILHKLSNGYSPNKYSSNPIPNHERINKGVPQFVRSSETSELS